MASESASQAVYEFGDFRIDAGRRLLFRKNETTALSVQPKVIDVLLYLVEHPGQVLEKDQLLADLWPGVVVEENSLTQVISGVRRILGETPRDHRYLATVPGRGYRFVASVVRVPERTPDAPPAHAGSTEPIAPGRARLPVALLAVGALAGIATLGWYARQTPPAAPAQLAASGPVQPAPNTVAVLPFENMSPAATDAYVAFGIAESILHRIGSVSGITAIARTSSFSMKGGVTDAREIGRKLGARYIVEGSVHRADAQLRVTAQLIDATTGAQVWSLRFEREMKDIFAVEDQIAQSIADALRVTIADGGNPHVRFGIDAYLAYLKGRALLATRRMADSELAVDQFSRAIELAPEFAAAYAALAEAHMQVAYLSRGSPEGILLKRVDRQSDFLEAAREAAPLLDRALELDPKLGETYVLRADLEVIAGDDAAAEADYRRGLALSPNYGAGHQRFAEFLLDRNQAEAEIEVDKAILVDPLTPRNVYFKGFLHMFEEEHGTYRPEAELHFMKALQVNPDFHPALGRLGAIRWHKGRFAEAIQLAERAVAIDPRSDWARAFLVEFYLEVGEIDAARSVLAQSPRGAVPIHWIGICLYEKRSGNAVQALRTDPTGRGFLDHDIEAYAIRDAALAAGDLERGRSDLAALAARPDLPLEHDPFRAVAVAQLSLVLGDAEETRRLATPIVRIQEYRLAYPRAAALTLLARTGEALDLLESSFALGHRKRWWYAFERDPAFEPLRSEARFRKLAQAARAHAAAEHETLEQMRARGEVPTRTPPATPLPGGC